MVRVSFSVPAGDLDLFLDGLLPAVPGGVHVEPAEEELARLWFVTVRAPDRAALEAAAGRSLDGWAVEEVPADGRARRSLGGVRVGRVVVRPPESPSPPAELVDVVVEPRSSVFGSGSHPTTRMCLELLQNLRPAGAVADLGCGSGTLAIAAAGLGWGPVAAVDRDEAAVAAARANARRTGVNVDARTVDLTEAAAPYRPTLLVNAAPLVQEAVLRALPGPVHTAVVSGFMASEADDVLSGWERAGFAVRERRDDDSWVAVTLVRDGAPEPLRRPADRTATAADEGPPPSGPAPTVAEVLDPAGPAERAGGLGQLATRLPDGGLVVSTSRTVEVGARAAVVLVPRLFRFDMTPQHETLGVAMRTLARVPSTWDADAETYDGFRRKSGSPFMFRGRFELSDGVLEAWVQVMSVGDEDQGAVHLVGKTAVRPLGAGDAS